MTRRGLQVQFFLKVLRIRYCQILCSIIIGCLIRMLYYLCYSSNYYFWSVINNCKFIFKNKHKIIILKELVRVIFRETRPRTSEDRSDTRKT